MSGSNETRRLYYEDSYQKSFRALVTGTGKDEEGSYILLDQTLFFPEGGGQPSDQGTVNGERVTDVQIRENEIRHYSKGSFETGMKIVGEIDWDRRFDLMQQHSGEHLVSGWIHSRFGYDNVGFHMGENFITIDLNGPMTEDDLASVEAEVNDYIWQDRAGRTFFASEEEIQTLPYRSKLDLTGEVRLAEFPGADLCACCGLHVKRAGEIGLVKLISVHRFRQGVRIEMLSGKRAFLYLNTHFKQNSLIAADLSVKPDETMNAVEKMKEEAFRLRGQIIRLEKEKYERLAALCQGKGDVLVFAADMDSADIRKTADEILNGCGGICLMLSGDEETGYRYAAGIRDGDIRELVKDMNQALDGRGGGKPFFAQGSLKAGRIRIEDYFREKNFSMISAE